MHIKIIIFSVACMAMFQPSQSIGIASVLTNTIGDIASIPLQIASIPFEIASIPVRIAKAKAAAVVNGVSNVASVVARGAGLKFRALGSAASAASNAVGNGLIDFGSGISNIGNTISGSMVGGSGSTSGNTRVIFEAPVAEEVVEEYKVRTPTAMELAYNGPFEQEMIEVPVESLRSVQVRAREPRTFIEAAPRVSNKVYTVWNTLNKANQGKVFRVRSDSADSPVVYEIVGAQRM